MSARRSSPALAAADGGQALILLLAVLAAVLVGAVALGWIAAGITAHGARQRAADLAALAAARALSDIAGRDGDAAGLIAAAVAVGRTTALRNGARDVTVAVSPADLPDRAVVTVRDPIHVPGGGLVGGAAIAEARPTAAAFTGDGAYTGPLARRQGQPMRPDVALAFDRLAAAARRSGIALVVVSAFRTDAEQARLFAAHPDPKWVARPGTSLHRLGTELDLGPASAYGWLASNAARFGFVKRYAWEPWHFGYARATGSASVGFVAAGDAGVPAWVPAAFVAPLRRAASRWSVGAALLAAQLQQESGFDPRSRSSAGALGIAQFMPGTARAYGLRDPLDPVAAIDAQAHLMHDLLQRLGSVPLALAAYNAGPAPVIACGCVPAIPETQAYVQRIVALTRGAGALTGAAVVRLVR